MLLALMLSVLSEVAEHRLVVKAETLSAEVCAGAAEG